MDNKPEETADTCTCDASIGVYDVCPFDVEVEGKETECDCCDYCREQCAQVI